MALFLFALAMWGAAGVLTAALLARRGHNFWLMAFMGIGYGPFLPVIWFLGARGQLPKSSLIRTDGVTRAEGWIDVVVGLDGSAETLISTKHVLDTLGPAIRKVRLVSVLDFEISNAPDVFETDERRIQHLEAAAVTLGFANAELALTSGQPDKALVDLAVEGGFDLLVVAHQRHPVTSVIKGSTAGRLAKHADLPVLIGPPA